MRMETQTQKTVGPSLSFKPTNFTVPVRTKGEARGVATYRRLRTSLVGA